MLFGGGVLKFDMAAAFAMLIQHLGFQGYRTTRSLRLLPIIAFALYSGIGLGI